jgi:hypothetical protein
MDKRQIVDEINHDIQRGVYEQFPVLREKLTHISRKLFTSIYVINDDKQLTTGEIQTLVENDYLKNDER